MPTLSKHIAIGTSSNNVQLWDTHAVKRVRTIHGHSGRVSSLAWNQHWLTTGGSDSLILQHDVRCERSWISTYKTHEQEVVGLKWNEDGSTLASGGNDNYLCLWDAKMSSSRRQHWVTPRLVSREHKAAVKALDWCPFPSWTAGKWRRHY
jgi:cell division cycle protein 20 (cofactor of APC complex)